MTSRSLTLFSGAALLVFLAGCSSLGVYSGITPDAPALPSAAPVAERALTSPADVTRSCVDALGDSTQDTAYDLTQVDVALDGDVVTVRWEYDALTYFSPTDNVEYIVGFKPLSGEEGYRA